MNLASTWLKFGIPILFPNTKQSLLTESRVVELEGALGLFSRAK